MIDTGIGVDGDDFVKAVSSIIDPQKLRWVWLTHDDADHTASIQRIMELAPNAKLVTHGFSALRMGDLVAGSDAAGCTPSASATRSMLATAR